LSKKSDRENKVSTGQTLARLERLARLVRSASHTQGLNAAQWEALRFLSRANSFSNSPGALAHYVSATKGTTSQTVLSLIKKGMITKSSRGADARSVVLDLTDKGNEILADDPLLSLNAALADLSEKTSKRFAKGLSELLHSEATRQGEPSFGTCGSCHHAAKKDDAVFCAVLKITPQVDDRQKLCVYHRANSH
jgi:DNA-binding MarR family transcriptional regulator